MKIFSFLENSISGKYLDSGNTFTRTKRSLSQLSKNNIEMALFDISGELMSFFFFLPYKIEILL